MHPVLRKASITEKKLLNPKVLEVTLRPYDSYTFKPGQFNSIKTGSAFRAYSVASLVSNNSFKNIISIGHQGLGSAYFNRSVVGETVEFIGPNGRFYLNERLKKHVLFLATGTGLAPFIPMFEQLALLNIVDTSVELYFGVRSTNELFYLDRLLEFKANNGWFDFEICLSQEVTGKYSNGRITDKYSVTDPNDTQVYLCGNPYMVEENISRIKELGLADEDIFYEKFTSAVKKDV
jgi:ferredoxin-NADP reductase